MERWIHKEGACQETVVSSRIRLARNLKNYPFVRRMQPSQKKLLARSVEDSLENIHLGASKSLRAIPMEELSKEERGSLLERHLVSPGFISGAAGTELLLSQDESLSLMVNEEDHIRLQTMQSGLNFQETYTLADRMDTVLDEGLPFAYDSQLGYLTACPTNLGTGLRASAMLHLPLLEKNNSMRRIAEQLSKLGFAVRGTYGEGSQVSGSYYQISNQITLGISEEEAIQSLESVVRQISLQEMEMRQRRSGIVLKDQIYRAFGVLRAAQLLSFGELMDLGSAVRLGISLQLFQALQYTDVDGLLFTLGDATLATQHKETKTEAGLSQKRADIVRSVMKKED